MLRKYKILWISDSPTLPCYDSETEVFTDNGWKLFKDCLPEDKFYTLNPENHKIELHHADKLVRKKHDGKMYLVESRSVNLCVTPNHKMYVGREINKKIVFELEEAKNIVGKNRYYLSYDFDGEFEEIYLINESEELKEDKWIEYNDYVWCAVVPPNHIIYVRREGKPVWCGNTGYANQSRHIVGDLAKRDDLDMFYLGAQHRGMPTWFTHNPHRLYTTKFTGSYKLLGAGGMNYCEDVMQKYLKRDVQPDLSFILADSFMYNYLVDNKHGSGGMDLGPSKFVFYFPSDGEPLPLGWDRVMRKMDGMIAMARWGQKQAIEAGFKNCDYIPHMINENEFYPLPEQVRKNLRAKWGIPEHYFVALSCYRNQPRKMPSELLKAWAEFAKDKEDVMLMLHSDPYDISAPIDTNSLIQRLGIANKVRWSGMSMINPFSVEELNGLYNMADVHALSTSGEGFCIPIIESLAAGVPNILPNFTTPSELMVGEKYGYLAKLKTTLTGTYNVERGIVDTSDLASKFQHAYENRDEVKKKGKEAVKHVFNNYSSRVILPKWHEYVNRRMEE